MIRLFIENFELDTLDNFSHQITYAVDDLNNLDSKTTTFSKTIVIPGSANNNKLLGNIFEFANSNFAGISNNESANVNYNFNASKAAKCRLDYNNITIVKGILRLLQINIDNESVEYEIAIFGELGGFFAKLGNKKLDDLDFSGYNHNYRVENFNVGTDRGFYAFVTNNETAIVNSTESFCSMQGVDYSEYFEIADQITIFNLNALANYGQHTINRYEWDGATFTVYIDDTFSTIPGTTFIAYILISRVKGFGYYYPLIDYGNYSTDKHDYKFGTFRPALHLREYIDKIIKGAGYTYESKFFKTDFFSRLIIPHNEVKLLTTKSDLFKGNYYGFYFLYDASYNAVFYRDLNIQKIYGSEFSTTDNIEYTFNGDATVSVNINAIINASIIITDALIDGFGFLSLAMSLYIGGVEVKRIEYNNNYNYTGDRPIFYPSFDLSGEYTINPSDNIKISFAFAIDNLMGGDVFAIITFDNNQILEIKTPYPIVTNIDYDDLLEINRTIPKNILQKDLFASVLKMFYLMVQEDKYRDKHLIIEPWTWFYNLNKNTYLDWSDKLDRSQPIKIKPMSEANARYYNIKYKSDNDYFNEFYRKKYNENYGDVRFDNQLDFAKDSETVDVIFSSTPLVGYAEEDKVTPAIFKWDGKIAAVNEERINSNIRIMQKKAILDVAEWNILDASGGILQSYTDYNYAGHLDDPDVPGSDINFGTTKELFFTLADGALGNNLFNTFYSSYLAEITDKDSRLLTAKFKLTDVDIFNRDFGKFIWIDGVLYRLNRIIDYNPNELCEVELLRVINTTYDNTVNAGEYSEIYLGGNVWQTKNYNGEFYQNGDPITQLISDDQILGDEEGAWCYYNFRTSSGSVWGKLYNWYAINDPRGIAPVGWKVPNSNDFNDLKDAADDNGYKLKAKGNVYWFTANGTDNFGFAAYGGGQRTNAGGSFREQREFGYFWASDDVNSTQANFFTIIDDETTLLVDKDEKYKFFSLRLIKEI